MESLVTRQDGPLEPVGQPPNANIAGFLCCAEFLVFPLFAKPPEPQPPPAAAFPTRRLFSDSFLLSRVVGCCYSTLLCVRIARERGCEFTAL